MATARLGDSQKQELVRRFRQGENTQALADHFGCSTTTVTRMVRAELGDQAYAALREERQKKGTRDRQIPLAISEGADDANRAGHLTPSIEATPEASEDQPLAALAEEERQEPIPVALQPPVEEQTNEEEPSTRQEHYKDLEEPLEVATASTGDDLDSTEPGATILAIDDADDFADEEDGEDDLLTSEEEEDDDEVSQEAGDFHTVAVLPIAVDDQRETLPAPWSPAHLPPSAYLLVDKTVELQARPLGEMPELGRLPSEEQDRQALVLFTNPRQAKRHCGRSQRVIKVPDLTILGRTAPYLLAQGISRVVIEGALYALPETQ